MIDGEEVDSVDIEMLFDLIRIVLLEHNIFDAKILDPIQDIFKYLVQLMVPEQNYQIRQF